jgi:hypothetical protein
MDILYSQWIRSKETGIGVTIYINFILSSSFLIIHSRSAAQTMYSHRIQLGVEVSIYTNAYKKFP